MGVDIYGREPTSETGRYFRKAWGGWSPILNVMRRFVPAATMETCKHWGTNDGDGLDDANSKNAAASLEEAIESGALDAFIEDQNLRLDNLPNEECRLCHGTGIRTDAIGEDSRFTDKICDEIEPRWTLFAGQPHPRAGQKGWCNGCNGRGYDRPNECLRYYEREAVDRWVEFLKECGGFNIH